MFRPIQIYNLLFSPDRQFNRFIRQRTGWAPVNSGLFRLAFHHKSLYPEIDQNNERLEFLGDAILAAVVTNYLFSIYPDKDEGFLTELKARIVSRSQLNRIAHRLMLHKYVQADMANSELQNHAIMGNTLEALTGAVYLDGNYNAARQFIEQKMIERFLNLDQLANQDDNFKSRLVEKGQEAGKTVTFSQLNEQLIDKQRYFTCGVFMDDQLMAKGSGYSKKEAEQIAARETLAQWQDE